jgi:hypothetical protein
MESYYIMIWILFVLFVVTGVLTDPKLDINYETEERILWYTDPIDNKRKFITLWKIRN